MYVRLCLSCDAPYYGNSAKTWTVDHNVNENICVWKMVLPIKKDIVDRIYAKITLSENRLKHVYFLLSVCVCV